MKDWTDDQRAFIHAHLQLDMTASELARFFVVKPADIWQVAYQKSKHVAHSNSGCTALHSPDGPRIWAGICGATILDAYEPLSLAEFHAIYPDGLRP